MMSANAVRGLTLLLLGLLGVACSSGGDKLPEHLRALDGAGFELQYDLSSGTFNIYAEDGALIVQRAFSEVAVIQDGQASPVAYRSSQRYLREAVVLPVEDALGTGRRLTVTMTGLSGAPDLILELTTHEGSPALTANLRAENGGAEPLRLDRLVPAKVDAERDGRLLLGGHPAEHRILEAGSFFIFDFFVDILPGDVAEPAETVLMGLVHGYQRGHSISNWNHAIHDLASGRTFVAGALDFSISSPMFNTSYDAELAVPDGARTPFTYWSGEFPFLPAGKEIGPGQGLASGPVFIVPWHPNPHQALEAYADAVKAYNGIRLWTDRSGDHRVPTGWNSWTGSGSSGGYGSGIDQELMVDNLGAMAEEFRDFGGEWFQIDDGYEYYYGDWDWRQDRFPDGAAWLADRIEAQGLIPGVWIAAFQVSSQSQVYADHVADGWFPETLPVIGGDSPVIDPTHPEVKAWLTDRYRRIRADGYRWLKTDFSYWALGAASFYQPNVTREEAYRQGLGAIKDGLDQGALEAGGSPGDTFWVSVSMVGPHVGYTDSVRPNLDTMPAWDREAPDQGRKEAQGFKPTVRSIARRYYLQNRVYLFNHDMLFFRSHLDESVPRISRDEARCLLTAVGLSGSVAKLGERLVDMEPEWIEDYRRVIPVFGHSARPLDLFSREYPEIWHLAVLPEQGLNTGGQGPAYDVVALFNWGSNDDLTTNPFTAMADEARQIAVDLADLDLDPDTDYIARDLWSGEVIEDLRGSLDRLVQPHTVQLFAVRPRLNRPQYIGGNRHILQGAVEIRSLEWETAGRLLLTYDAAPGSTKAPCEHLLVFYIPPGWTLAQSQVDGAAANSLQADVQGNILSLRFQVDARRDVSITLTFNES